MIFFDAFTEVGPRARKHPAMPWQLAHVLADLDYCSISGALVASTLSVSYEAMYSNLELCDWLKPHDHLFPIWNVMPHQCGDFPEPRKLEVLMRQHNVRAIALHPRANGWDWLADHSQVLLRWLEKKQILTIMPRPEVGAYSDLDRFLDKYPKLPFLLVSAGWPDQHYVLPLLQKHRNLHITFDHYQINYGLEDYVAMGLENQLLFGSNSPSMSIGAHRTYVDYAKLPAAVKQKIAGGNLARLLHGQKPPCERVNKAEDKIMAAARRGEVLPVPVVDMHMHILHEGLNTGGGGYAMSHGGPKGTFAMLQRLGCVGGGFMSWNGPVSGDSLAGNCTVADALDVAPPGYFGLATFDPISFTQAELAKIIPAVYEDKRFVGIKPYHLFGVEFHHPSYDVLWQFGNRHGLYAGIHRSRGDFLEIDTLAKKYPRIRWVNYHSGSDYRTADGIIDCIKKYPNVYAEITLTPVTAGIIEYLVKHAGPDRVLYGSDLPMRDPRQQLGWVVYSRLAVAVKEQILAKNALKMLGPCLKRLPTYNRPSI
ncbi:MAG: amidohydrolase family protein [Verrucomicrobiota bacterium]